jgi:hypothetical protein
MLYFLCHADGERLALGAENLITLNDFRKIKPNRLDHHAGCLVFINGCETAVGAADGGFLKATCRPGFYGFIGTETKVPDLVALRFGVEFLREFLSSGTALFGHGFLARATLASEPDVQPIRIPSTERRVRRQRSDLARPGGSQFLGPADRHRRPLA